MGYQQCTSFSSNAINNIQNNLIIPKIAPDFAINYLNENINNSLIVKKDFGYIKKEYQKQGY